MLSKRQQRKRCKLNDQRNRERKERTQKEIEKLFKKTNYPTKQRLYLLWYRLQALFVNLKIKFQQWQGK